MMSKKNALGKGLGAIFPDLMDDPSDKPHIAMCGIEELSPNRFQPRKSFDEEQQKRLADSIKKNGLLQPILVRKSDNDAGYEIIAGERRWRAAQAAGLRDVPILIRHKTKDVDLAELSLIENIQREELNPIEESGAYYTLMETFHLSQEEISRRVGKDRSTIANSLRLLNLPREAKEALAKKEISAGHARTILSVDSPEEQMIVLKEILDKKLSVREAEKLVQGHKTRSQKGKEITKDQYLLDLERKIAERLMARSSIKPLRSGGVIEIRFTSSDDLNRLSDILMNVDDH